jgi:hypothetical protein
MHLFSAHGMWQLFNLIPLLIGDRIPRGDEHYQCFMLLQEISAILCADALPVEQPAYLRILIAEYLSEMVRLYPHKPLTPKFHYLLHCPSLMKR